MSDERDDSIETAVEPTAEPETAPEERPARRSDDFLVPGPTPESNAGLRQWGCTWLAFSLILILLMLGISFVCLTLANWTGLA
ncbi:MAG TPA: hypothetical protein VEX37_02225 [Thermomicrobiales bacterium]|nr:hypothetical protein [Thermomicrobiales bacterium]